MLSHSLDMYGSISGREEETTNQLALAITERLTDEIEEHLHGRAIGAVKFGVHVLKNRSQGSEESRVGADLAGIIRLTVGNTTVSKTFLAQAKVGKFRNAADRYPTVRNSNLLSQCKKMLAQSSDSFVFIYTERGIFIVPALSVHLVNKNTLNLREHYCYERFGLFYREFFRCFIGDHKISPRNFDPNRDLPRLASETGAANLLVVTATTTSDQIAS